MILSLAYHLPVAIFGFRPLTLNFFSSIWLFRVLTSQWTKFDFSLIDLKSFLKVASDCLDNDVSICNWKYSPPKIRLHLKSRNCRSEIFYGKRNGKYSASYCTPYYLQSVDPILKSEIKNDKHCESRSTIFIWAKKTESNHFIHSKCQYSIKTLTRQLKPSVCLFCDNDLFHHNLWTIR